MDEIIYLIKSNPKTSITIFLSAVGLVFGLLRLLMTRKKLRMEKIEFENKKSKFSLYLEDSFRKITKSKKGNNKKYLLFHVKISNHSNSKNSFYAILEVLYSTEHDETKNLKLKHDSTLFKTISNQSLTMLTTDIRVDEKEIKSGWLIFPSPAQLDNVRIKKFSISITDSSGYSAQISSTLMKDLIYEN